MTNVIPLHEIDRIVDRALAPHPALVPGKPHVRRLNGRWCATPMRDCSYPRQYGATPVEAFNNVSALCAVVVFG